FDGWENLAFVEPAARAGLGRRMPPPVEWTGLPGGHASDARQRSTAGQQVYQWVFDELSGDTFDQHPSGWLTAHILQAFRVVTDIGLVGSLARNQELRATVVDQRQVDAG